MPHKHTAKEIVLSTSTSPTWVTELFAVCANTNEAGEATAHFGVDRSFELEERNLLEGLL